MSRKKTSEGENEIGLEQRLEEAYGVKRIKEIVLDYQLPPPIYCQELTTLPERAGRTCKHVKNIEDDGKGRVIITSLEGVKFIVPMYKVRYIRED